MNRISYFMQLKMFLSPNLSDSSKLFKSDSLLLYDLFKTITSIFALQRKTERCLFECSLKYPDHVRTMITMVSSLNTALMDRGGEPHWKVYKSKAELIIGSVWLWRRMDQLRPQGGRPGLTGVSQGRRNIILDVGGERFIASRNILETFPATR